MNQAILALFLSVSVTFADFGEDDVPAAPDILSRIISGAERSGAPLHSEATKGERTVYYLRSAEYVGECSAPFGPVHVARLFFIRSGIRGQATPPARGHTFIVFYDAEFRVRGHWRIEADLGQLQVRRSKLLVGESTIIDYEHLPQNLHASEHVDFQPIPIWK